MEDHNSLQQWIDKTNWSLIPSHMRDGVIDWVSDAIPPGSFLSLMLQHNIYEAAQHADEYNARSLANWCMFMYWELPSACHGKHYKEWKGWDHRMHTQPSPSSQSSSHS